MKLQRCCAGYSRWTANVREKVAGKSLSRPQLLQVYKALRKLENSPSAGWWHDYEDDRVLIKAADFMGWGSDPLLPENRWYFDDYQNEDSEVFRSQVATVAAFTLAIHEFELSDEDIVELVVDKMSVDTLTG